jgi:hypothetical protein
LEQKVVLQAPLGRHEALLDGADGTRGSGPAPKTVGQDPGVDLVQAGGEGDRSPVGEVLLVALLVDEGGVGLLPDGIFRVDKQVLKMACRM